MGLGTWQTTLVVSRFLLLVGRGRTARLMGALHAGIDRLRGSRAVGDGSVSAAPCSEDLVYDDLPLFERTEFENS